MGNTPPLQDILTGIELGGKALTDLIGSIQNMPFRKQTKEQLSQLETDDTKEIEFAKLEAQEISDLQAAVKEMEAQIAALKPHLEQPITNP